MNSTSQLEEHGRPLIDNGYKIVPIAKGYKFPKGIDEWQKIDAELKDVERWAAGGFTGVGIKTGEVVALDMDIMDDDVALKLQDFALELTGLTLQRFGLEPKSLLLYRTDEPFKKITSRTYLDGDNEHKVEVLADGQQFVAFHIHPDTGKPYYWVDGISPADIAADELPVLSVDQAHAIVAEFERIAIELWDVKPRAKKETSASERVDMSTSKESRILEHFKPPVDLTDPQIDRVLELVVDRCEDYFDWVEVGMALYHQYGGTEDGFQKWDEWSQQSLKYNDDDNQMRKKWHSFKPDLETTNPFTFNTLMKEASKIANSQKRARKLADGGLPMLSLGDLANALKPIDWLIEDYLEKNTTGLLVGDPQAFKTFLALQWALTIAAGGTWNGRQVKAAPVIYISGEGHNGFARRVQAWRERFGAEFNVDEDTPFRLAKGAVSFCDLDSVKELVKIIDDEIKNMIGSPTEIGLVVIDTLARNFGEGDENSAGDVSRFIEHVEKYIRDKYNATVLIVHHAGHAAKGRGRGSSAITGAADFEFYLARENLEGMRTVLLGRKMKDAAMPPETRFEASEVPFTIPGGGETQSLVLDVIEKPLAQEELGLSPLQAKLFEFMNDPGIGANIERETLRDLAIEEGVAKDRKQFNNTIKRMIDGGLVIEHDGRVSINDETADFMGFNTKGEE